MKGNRLHTSEVFLLTPLREGRLKKFLHQLEAQCDFYSRPCGRGDFWRWRKWYRSKPFLLTPLREGRRSWQNLRKFPSDFYSRPCGRGDPAASRRPDNVLISTHAPAGGATLVNHNDAGRIDLISTHAPAGGATRFRPNGNGCRKLFLLTPLREGRRPRPSAPPACSVFLLTPLREGRPGTSASSASPQTLISTHAPAGGATETGGRNQQPGNQFLLTPLREGRQKLVTVSMYSFAISTHAPAGGATVIRVLVNAVIEISTHAPAGGATKSVLSVCGDVLISTHAPAGGATAIFHKSVMRFCGKLPKDDTVLCLASFGFPRRDPKAVYLAWISCANLPQKCVRQGLALKDQGTSCFHEGLASHAFDPVLV